MTYVVTYIEVQANATDKGMDLIRRYQASSQEEAGNAAVEAFQETHRRNRFVIGETWKEESAFQAHERAAHTAAFRSGLGEIQISPGDQRVHQVFEIEETGRAVSADALFVVTHVDVPPPRREETEVLLRRIAQQARQDEGNMRYDVFQQISPRTNHFSVVASWHDLTAFTRYEMKPHTRQFREALGPMLGAPYEDRLYALVGTAVLL